MDNYINELQIALPPKKLYDAVTTLEGLSNWWTSQIEIYPQIGGIAIFHFGKQKYVVMKITKLLPHKEIVWKCVEQYFEVSSTDKTNEWVGTTVKITINENKDNTTTLTFVHNGLNSELSGYEDYKKKWDYYLKSLKQYLETGKGKPYSS